MTLIDVQAVSLTFVLDLESSLKLEGLTFAISPLIFVLKVCYISPPPPWVQHILIHNYQFINSIGTNISTQNAPRLNFFWFLVTYPLMCFKSVESIYNLNTRFIMFYLYLAGWVGWVGFCWPPC